MAIDVIETTGDAELELTASGSITDIEVGYAHALVEIASTIVSGGGGSNYTISIL